MPSLAVGNCEMVSRPRRGERREPVGEWLRLFSLRPHDRLQCLAAHTRTAAPPPTRGVMHAGRHGTPSGQAGAYPLAAV
eukprot:4796981-Prymnesium_polylepis.1